MGPGKGPLAAELECISCGRHGGWLHVTRRSPRCGESGDHDPPDLAQARNSSALDRPNAASFTFQLFDDDRERKDTKLARVLELNDFAKQLLDFYEKGTGVWVIINATDGKGRKASNVTRIRAVWQEDDEGFEGSFHWSRRWRWSRAKGDFIAIGWSLANGRRMKRAGPTLPASCDAWWPTTDQTRMRRTSPEFCVCRVPEARQERAAHRARRRRRPAALHTR